MYKFVLQNVLKLFCQKNIYIPSRTEDLFVGSAVERREEVMSQQRVEGRHKDHNKAKT